MKNIVIIFILVFAILQSCKKESFDEGSVRFIVESINDVSVDNEHLPNLYHGRTEQMYYTIGEGDLAEKDFFQINLHEASVFNQKDVLLYLNTQRDKSIIAATKNNRTYKEREDGFYDFMEISSVYVTDIFSGVNLHLSENETTEVPLKIYSHSCMIIVTGNLNDNYQLKFSDKKTSYSDSKLYKMISNFQYAYATLPENNDISLVTISNRDISLATIENPKAGKVYIINIDQDRNATIKIEDYANINL